MVETRNTLLSCCLAMFLVQTLSFNNDQNHDEHVKMVSSVFKCACKIQFDVHSSYSTSYEITSEFVTTPEDVSCFRSVVEKSLLMDDMPIDATFRNSNLDLFTPDMFGRFEVNVFRCYNCTMITFPYDLLCTKDLLYLFLVDTPIPKGRLIPGGFKKCTQLHGLIIDKSNLLDIPSGSFEGLESLENLWLASNRIQGMPDLSELKNLKRLNLANNPIGPISKTAFQNAKLTDLNLRHANITKIQDGAFDLFDRNSQVYLHGNPFYCDCSLQWLQDWLANHLLNKSTSNFQVFGEDHPQCVAPYEGPLKSFDFYNFSSCAPTAFQHGIFQNILSVIQWMWSTSICST